MKVQQCGISLNKKNFGMLHGHHIRFQIGRRTGLSRFQEITYGLWVKDCNTDAQRGLASHMETIYTLHVLDEIGIAMVCTEE